MFKSSKRLKSLWQVVREVFKLVGRAGGICRKRYSADQSSNVLFSVVP